jgi:hypothetical protein
MGPGTRLKADLGSRWDMALQLRQPSASAEALLPHSVFLGIHAVYLKHILCQINADSNNLHVGLLLFS